MAEADLTAVGHRVVHGGERFTVLHLGNGAIAFTAGAGEYSSLVRRRILAGLESSGIRLDGDRTEARCGETGVMSPEALPVTVLVIPTDEEREIATQTLGLLDAV